VTVGGTVTTTVADPDFVVSCVEVAVIVAVPALAGVNTPRLLTLPIPAGLTDQVTAVVKFTCPLIVCLQADVWVVRIAAGEQVTVTETMVGSAGAALLLNLPPQPVRSVKIATADKAAANIQPKLKAQWSRVESGT
jgi:hypothetical protein